MFMIFLHDLRLGKLATEFCQELKTLHIEIVYVRNLFLRIIYSFVIRYTVIISTIKSVLNGQIEYKFIFIAK